MTRMNIKDKRAREFYEATGRTFPYRLALECEDRDDEGQIINWWCVNEYWLDDEGSVRRDTIATDLTEAEALRLESEAP